MMPEPTEGSMDGEGGCSPTDQHILEALRLLRDQFLAEFGYSPLGIPRTFTAHTGSDQWARWTGRDLGVWCWDGGQSRRLLSFATLPPVGPWS